MENLKRMFSLKIINTTDPILSSFTHIPFFNTELQNFDAYLGKMSAEYYGYMRKRVKIQLLFNGKPFYGTEYTIGDYKLPSQGLSYHINEVIKACDQYMNTNNQKLLNVIEFAFGKSNHLCTELYQELLEEASVEICVNRVG